MKNEELEEVAARWFWKRDSGIWSETDQAEFDSWLDSSTTNRVTYLRLSAGWKRAAKLKALGAGVCAGVIPRPGNWGDIRFPGGAASTQSLAPRSGERVAAGRVRGIFAAAATVLVAVTALYLFNASFLQRNSYSTPIGGLDTVPLADGSQITLNTDTRIRVDLNENERRIELDRGEAFFEVAKDPSRPFVVQIGDKRVMAVGTAFSVRREGKDIRVAVTEGKVQVGGKILSAGSIATTAKTDMLVRETSSPEAEQFLSWRRGLLVFEATPLAEAVAEFNRYNARKIVIDDPVISGFRIGGNFRADNTEAFLWLLQNGFRIDVEEDDGEIVLKRMQ